MDGKQMHPLSQKARKAVARIGRATSNVEGIPLFGRALGKVVSPKAVRLKSMSARMDRTRRANEGAARGKGAA